MKQLKPVISYQFFTKLKEVGIFYSIQYLICAFIMVMVGLLAQEMRQFSMDPSTALFIGIVGILGFTEDFKCLLQNGYTRKYIYLGTAINFLLLSGLMALVDTLGSHLLHLFLGRNFTVFGLLYGYGNPIGNWLFFLGLYFTICSLFYLGVLVVKKLGNRNALFLGVGLGGLVVILVAVFQYILAADTVAMIGEMLLKMMGFVEGFASNQRTNLLYPILTFTTLSALLQLASYAILRRSELK